MHPSVQVVHDYVDAIEPFDEMEAEHRLDVLRWLARTDDVFRRSKPATPQRHLVSYFAIIDPVDGASLLVDHINAGLFLPPGGHVEPGEDPVETVRREAREELGVEAVFAMSQPRPSFVTVTLTRGVDRGHTDVSLWFVLTGRTDMAVTIDRDEFRSVRWWTPEIVRSTDPTLFDPHYFRFIEKLGS